MGTSYAMTQSPVASLPEVPHEDAVKFEISVIDSSQGPLVQGKPDVWFISCSRNRLKYLQWEKRWAGCCCEACHLPGDKPYMGTRQLSKMTIRAY